MDRVSLATAVLRAVIAGVKTLDPLTADELDAIAALEVLRGRAVTVDGVQSGSAEGVESDGALRLRQGNSVRRIHSGTVRLADGDTVSGE
jgi:hypothetical protein